MVTVIHLCFAGHHPSATAADSSFVTPMYAELPLGAIRPQGWLLSQLKIMKNGTTGHLDEVYGKVKDDNGWLGGQGDGWEETPYWLDGAVPLAYLLDDQALKDKVLKYINWTLNHQRASGYFGPITEAERKHQVDITPDSCRQGEDWWPKMVMLKVLKQYYMATSDKRVISFMSKYFRYQRAALNTCPVGQWTEWAASRGAENVMMAQWLYGITKEDDLLDLAATIESQSFPWSRWLGNRNWVIDAAAQQNGENWMHRHAVNVGMALKSPAINYQRTHDKAYLDALKTGFGDLMNLHGLPMGIFSGDEDLHGNDPTQGVELCAIVETMYSLENIMAITGDPYYMDALERMAFNALPPQTTDDYNAKQYFQMANQIQIKRGVFNFSLPFDREMNNVLGMRSGYTCCLANMHQGWTKFAQHLWYQTADKGLAALEYAPSEITTKAGAQQTQVTIREETSYPFEDKINLRLATKQSVDFPLQLRIPAWCSEATVMLNGKKLRTDQGGQIITISRTWKDGDQLQLQLPMQVSTSNWGRNSRAVERGPLVYALKIDEAWEKGHDEAEGDYFTVLPKSDWNFGLLEKDIQKPQENLKVKKVQEVTNDFVWNLAHVPLEITAQARKIPHWKISNDVASQPVSDRTGIYKGEVSQEVTQITLVPFGCTKIRVVAFPVVPTLME